MEVLQRRGSLQESEEEVRHTYMLIHNAVITHLQKPALCILSIYSEKKCGKNPSDPAGKGYVKGV
jgi:hypothetical protein